MLYEFSFRFIFLFAFSLTPFKSLELHCFLFQAFCLIPLAKFLIQSTSIKEDMF